MGLIGYWGGEDRLLEKERGGGEGMGGGDGEGGGGGGGWGALTAAREEVT